MLLLMLLISVACEFLLVRKLRRSCLVTSGIVTPFTSVIEIETLVSVSSYSLLSTLLPEVCSVQPYTNICLVLVSRDCGRNNTPSDRTVQDYVTWKNYDSLHYVFKLRTKCGWTDSKQKDCV